MEKIDYEQLLNPEQLKPVYDTQGAVLVLAGAGSGKTRVLTYRIAYLMSELNVSPYNILSITFTNKAASEMKERISAVTGSADIWISTFHSLCARILRYEIDHLDGYDKNFTIYSASDSARLITRIFKEIGVEEDSIKKNIKWHISNAKNLGITPEKYCSELTGDNDIILHIMKRYDEELTKNNALDFDDLLTKTVELFVNNPQVLERYQERFKYIHVDEFQDTNKIQMLLVRMLSYKYGNLFVVGDDDQSIYGWRGAEVGNILDFKSKFPGCRVYKLQQNYRSTPTILDCANKVISHNHARMGKELWTDTKNGINVVYHNCYDSKKEADYVLNEIDNLVRNNGYRYNDFAILVRQNALTREFEEKMSLYGISYRLYGGFKFYDRKEILDVMAYLKAVANPKDTDSILRIINFPKRGIGDTATTKLVGYCKANNLSIPQALDMIETNTLFNSAGIRKFVLFRNIYNELLQSVKELPLTQFITHLIELVDFTQAYDMDSDDGRNKLENINEIIGVVSDFCKNNTDADLDMFLQSVSLLSDTDDVDEQDCVTIATVHGVKGLEFRCVFIVGCEENIFPSARSKDSPSELEEERRCMYVAITRARERLYLTSAASRFRFGRYENNLVSRFVEEAGLIKHAEAKKEQRAESKYVSIVQRSGATSTRKPFRPSAVGTKDLSEFVNGANVRHPKYGLGVILSRNGESAKVSFQGLGTKEFSLSIAPLEVVKGE